MHRICQQRAKIEFCNPAARFAAAVKAWLIAISIVIVNNLPPLFAGITILSSRERDRERVGVGALLWTFPISNLPLLSFRS